MTARIAALATVCAVLVAAGATAAGGSTAATRCNLWAAPYGADTNAGTEAAPFLTLAKLAASLTPGQVGCLPPGSTFARREVIAGAGTGAGRVTITTAPGGARAVLADGVETTQASRFLTLSNLMIGALDSSPTRNVAGTVVLRGYSTALTGSDVGPGTLKEAGRSCVVLDHAGSAVVDGNVLHECNGTSTMYGAGVLAANASGARITDNVIYGIPGGDGLAFSPNAQASAARRNLIVDNLGGIYFGGDAKLASRDTIVEQNVITRDSRYDVHSGYVANGPVGARNVVRRNCIWSPGGTTASGGGFTLTLNRKVNPRVVKGKGTYTLAPSSPCRAYAPRP
jgi:hypothetical protein